VRVPPRRLASSPLPNKELDPVCGAWTSHNAKKKSISPDFGRAYSQNCKSPSGFNFFKTSDFFLQNLILDCLGTISDQPDGFEAGQKSQDQSINFFMCYPDEVFSIRYVFYLKIHFTSFPGFVMNGAVAWGGHGKGEKGILH
jgi:hypothetical protein